MTSHSGENNADLLLSALKDTSGWSLKNIRERFCGGSFDGQCIKLNVPNHFAEKMLLEKDFTRNAITWDIAHPTELVREDTKEQARWLQDLDTIL